MRDFKLPEEPDLLPEDFQLDDPFAAEFISEPLPGTEPAQEEIPEEPLYEEEFPQDMESDIPVQELQEEAMIAEVYEDPIPAESDFQEYPADITTEEDLSSIDPDALEEKLERPPQKGRPKRRSKVALFGLPHLAAAAIWLFVIVAIGVSIGRIAWVCASDVLAFGREEKIVTVSITHSDDMDSIAKKLREAGLIRYEEVFKLYAEFSHAEDKISTGTYTLNTFYDYHALVGQMTASSKNRAIVEGVLIPEGYTCRQIFQRLEDRGVCTVEELEA